MIYRSRLNLIAIFGLLILFSATLNAASWKTQTDLENDAKSKIMYRVLSDLKDVPSKDIKLSIKGLPPVQAISDEVHSIEFKISPKAKLDGKQLITLLFMNKYLQVLDEIKVEVDVDIFDTIFKAKRVIRQGEIFDDSMIEKSYESIISKPVRRIKNYDDLIGREVKTTIGENTVITEWMTQDKTLIFAGQDILIKVENNNVLLNVKGTALEDGSKGDYIRARTNLKNKKVVKGRVISDEAISLKSLY